QLYLVHAMLFRMHNFAFAVSWQRYRRHYQIASSSCNNSMQHKCMNTNVLLPRVIHKKGVHRVIFQPPPPHTHTHTHTHSLSHSSLILSPYLSLILSPHPSLQST